jgi:chromate transporter
MPEAPQKVPLRDIFRVFFTIGASSFGGGVTGWMHRITVTQRGWLTNDKFLSGLALGQVLPAPLVTG